MQKYQERLEESWEEEVIFFFDSVELLYYHLQKAILSRKGGPYIDSPKWSKNKNTTINPKNNDNNRFQYGLTVALNHQNIKKKPSTNIKN